MEEIMGKMGNLAENAKRKTDEQLKDQELSILLDSSINLESFRAKISDQASYDKLIKAVDSSTKQNESLAQLKQRISNLGSGVVAVAKEVIGFV